MSINLSKSTLLRKPSSPNSEIKVLLMNYITNKNPTMKVNIPHNTVEILKILIKNSSDEFDIISSNLQKIIDDNKIDFKDIPEFIQLVENIYILIVRHRKKLAPFNGKTLATTSGEILKIIIKLLVEMEHFSLNNFISADMDGTNEEDTIDVNNDAKQGLIENSNKVIDVCVKLLLIPINNDCKIARKIFSCCC
jgi:hypothetical protein